MSNTALIVAVVVANQNAQREAERLSECERMAQAGLTETTLYQTNCTAAAPRGLTSDEGAMVAAIMLVVALVLGSYVWRHG